MEAFLEEISRIDARCVMLERKMGSLRFFLNTVHQGGNFDERSFRNHTMEFEACQARKEEVRKKMEEMQNGKFIFCCYYL